MVKLCEISYVFIQLCLGRPKMREKAVTSPELFQAEYDAMQWCVKKSNPMVLQLEAIDKLLDELPELLTAIHENISAPAGKAPLKSKSGRPVGITSEQALRCVILKQLRGFSYRELAFEIDANPLYRKFTRFYGYEIPHYSTIERVVKRISDDSVQAANKALVLLGIKKKAEDGKAIRHDTTVVGTDIIYPMDSRLLSDVVRVLTRLMSRIQQEAGGGGYQFNDRTRRSGKRAYQIVVGKGKNIEARRALLYRDLLKVQKEVVDQAENLAALAQGDKALRAAAVKYANELRELIPLARQVYDQAKRRVIDGETVPVSEKLFSIFETHTDLICRGKKGSPSEFGHKVDFAIGKSGLVTRYEILDGNPGDGEVLERSLEYHKELFGFVPNELTADRRYFSSANEEMAGLKGVKKVAISKPGKLSATRRQLQRQPWFRRLLNWRAGIEGCLSTLLRSFGLGRCLWKGKESFNAYVGLSVLTYNLRLLAGHLLKI